MGRGRGKGKKQNSLTARDDSNNGEEENIPTYKKRGRPQKPLKNETEEEEEEDTQKIKEEEENGENTKGSLSNKDVKNQAVVENGRKRKKFSQMKESSEEIGVGVKINSDDSVKFVGFRQIGSRRKNKPHRAAEVGVGCK